MKRFMKRVLATVLTVLLAFPAGFCLSEEQGMDISEAIIGSSDEVYAVDTAVNADDGSDYSSEDEVFSDAVDPEIGEADDAELGGEEEDPAPEAAVTTYWFMVEDELYAEQTVGDGEAIQRPDDPAAPKGMVFSGWFLEDGTRLFVEGEEIAHADSEHPFINVLARFEDVAEPGDEEAVPGDSPVDTETGDTPAEAGTVNAPADMETGDSSADADAETGDASVDTDAIGETTANTTDIDVENQEDTVTTPETEGEEDGEDTASDNDGTDAPDGDQAENGVENTPETDDTNTDQDADSDQTESDETSDGEQSGESETSDSAQGESNESSDEAQGENPADEQEDGVEIQPVRVTFATEPEDAVVTVFAVQNNDEAADQGEAEERIAEEVEAGETVAKDGEPKAVKAQEDGSWLLLPGEYTYSAVAEGYKPLESVAFTVADEPLEIAIELEEEEAQPVSVVFNATPEEVVVTVYPAVAEEDAEPIPAQEDGSFLLVPGEYTYSASAEGYISVEAVPFTVEDEPLEIAFELEAEAAEEAEEPEETVPFDQSRTVGSVTITVRAEAGAFPAGAEMDVSLVNVQARQEADEAIDEIRDEDKNVAAAYTYDIKVVDEEGNELQPADGYKVEVSFAMAQAADGNLEANVYHVTEEDGELKAEKLEAEADGETVTAVSEGFSIYTVEFTYGEMQYVLRGGASVALSEILYALGMTGIPTAVSVSDESLFDATPENDEWFVSAKRPFNSEEWMVVTIDGIRYEITVTDDNTISVEYVDAAGISQGTKACIELTGDEIVLTHGNLSGGWYTVTGVVDFTQPLVISGEVNLVIADGATLNAKQGIDVQLGAHLIVWTQSVGGNMGTINADGTAQGHSGIGGHNEPGVTGDITIHGGYVKAKGGDYAPGIWGGNVEIDGGAVDARGGAPQGSSHPAGIKGNTAVSLSYADGAKLGDMHVRADSYADKVTLVKDFQDYNNGQVYNAGQVFDPSVLNNVLLVPPYGAATVMVDYVDAAGTLQDPKRCTVVTESDTSWSSGSVTGGWYVVDNNVTIESRVTVTGNVKLILYDDKTLKAKAGITVAQGNSLNVYVQSDGTGALFAGTMDGNDRTCQNNSAGIGGGNSQSAGTIIIHGGTVTAVGGNSQYFAGAGIGGGNGGAGGTVTINGGTVTATGGNGSEGSGAGIGGGCGGDGGSITIDGGADVTATGGKYGAGIGGGYHGSGGIINIIRGGTIVARGGHLGAGIGGGSWSSGGTITIRSGRVEAYGGQQGAGIGGGGTGNNNHAPGDGGNICIYGGTVIATGNVGAGIGSGSASNGSLGASSGTIEIHGGEVTATGNSNSAGIGGGLRGTLDTVTITGGTVKADGWYGGAGIGGGNLGAGGTVIICGGKITATGRSGGAGIGSGDNSNGGGTTTLNWTSATMPNTSINASSYTGTLKLAKSFKFGTTLLEVEGEQIITDEVKSTIAGKTLVPYQGKLVFVPYVDTAGNDMGTEACVPVVAQTTLSSGWYAVTADALIEGRLAVNGNVNLILCDDKTLTASQGVHLTGSNSLTIWGQARGTGALYAGCYDDNGEVKRSCESNCAGIGGGNGGAGGTVIIYGGMVYATGGQHGAGIGGGFQGEGGAVTITGGTVTATGGMSGAGIGGGCQGANGAVNISGGTIHANGGESAAGIGNGYAATAANGAIAITGGTVNAKGSKNGAGIGTCYVSKATPGAIAITGGNVTAKSTNGAGIGRGYNSSADPGTTILRWTKKGDSICASSYDGTVKLTKDFLARKTDNSKGALVESTGNDALLETLKSSLGGMTLVPMTGDSFTVASALYPEVAGKAVEITVEGIPSTRAVPGAMVTMTVPRTGSPEVFQYGLCSLMTDEETLKAVDFTLTDTEGVYTFTMPSAGVTATFTQWAKLQEAIDAAAKTAGGGTVTLRWNVTAVPDVDVKPLTIPAGLTATLDLNGHTIDRGLMGEGKTAQSGGNVITVKGTLTVTGNGTITGGNNTGDGGGVVVTKEDGATAAGRFTLQGGRITGNHAASGGGVYVNQSTFTMTGGAITSNTATSTSYAAGGGGVYVNGSASTFNMTGGTIGGENTGVAKNGNAANDGGGVYVDGGTFNLSDGSIARNTAIKNGGGVYVDGGSTFTMTGGSVTGNNTNWSENSGGGVFVRGSTFKMTNGTIGGTLETDKNTANYGGGVEVYSGSFEMTGGNITGNVANIIGGGVDVYDGTFEVSGTPVISGNTALDGTTPIPCNVNLVTKSSAITSDRIITVTGALADSKGNKAQIGVTLETGHDLKFTEGYASNNANANPETFFSSDDNTYSIGWNDTKTEAVLGLPMTQKLKDYEGTYDGQPHGIAVEVTEPASGYTVMFGEEEGIYNKKELTYKDKGSYTVYYQITAKGYIPVFGSAKVTINPAPLTINAEPQSKVEGEKDPALTYEAHGLAKGEKLTGALTREPGELPGIYKITQGTLTAPSSNYSLTFTGANFIIGEKPSLTFSGDISQIAGATPVGKRALAYAWSQVDGAEGYDLYFKKCDGKSGYQLVETLDGADILNSQVTGLKKGTSYKAYIMAWRKEAGQKVYIGKASPYIHAIAGGFNKAKKICNTRAVKVKKANVSLSVGQKSQIRASVKGIKKGYKVLKHVSRLRYYSSDTSVAKVNKRGRITAVAPGTCTIYVMANNGVYATVNVTVTN